MADSRVATHRYKSKEVIQGYSKRTRHFQECVTQELGCILICSSGRVLEPTLPHALRK